MRSSRRSDPRGQPVYWIGPAGPARMPAPAPIFRPWRSGLVSVTPLQIDLTRHAALPTIGRWLESL